MRKGQVTDARTDIWALGVLLYDLASGTRPFAGATGAELFSSILRDPPATLPPGVPVSLRKVIERCRAKDPSRRHQTATEVREALEGIGAAAALPAWRGRVSRPAGVLLAAVLLAALAWGVAGDVAGLRTRFGGTGGQARVIRLAVLPFENLTGDAGQEFFSDGLTEDMITQLGRLHPDRLSVIARISSMRYKKSDKPIDQIGRELGVDYLVEVSARKEAGRVRIKARLVRVSDQSQRWTDSYERELAGILSVQSDVARGIARSLSLTLLPAEQTRLAGARPIDPEAYEAYLRGRHHLSRASRADNDAAQQYFEVAIQKDPAYALAYLGLNRVWNFRDQMHLAPPAEARSRANDALTEALRLDNASAEAHFALAMKLTWHDWNFAAADGEFRRALELNPNLADAHAIHADYLIFMKRRDEARGEINRALQLDPLNALVQVFAGRRKTWPRYRAA